MSKRPNLSALADAAGSVRARVTQESTPAEQSATAPERPALRSVPPSRAGTKPLTGFFPGEVRTQLKILAAEKGRSMENMLAEALNDLFAKYGKPEIAPAAERTKASA